MLTLNQIQQLESMSPPDVYFTVSSVFDGLRGLGCSEGSVDAGVLFYLAYKSDGDELLNEIVAHIRRYASAEDCNLFAHVITRLSMQMNLSVIQSQQLCEMVENIIKKMYM